MGERLGAMRHGHQPNDSLARGVMVIVAHANVANDLIFVNHFTQFNANQYEHHHVNISAHDAGQRPGQAATSASTANGKLPF
jgi:hypothetical protein